MSNMNYSIIIPWHLLNMSGFDFDYGIDSKYKKLTDEEMETFYQIVYQNGIKNLIKE